MIPDAYTAKTVSPCSFVAALAAACLLIGCSEPSDSQPDAGDSDASSSVPLVAPDSWVVIEAADDPIADAPDSVMCDPENGTGVEQYGPDLAFAVNTRECAYVAVSQPTLAPLSEGDTVFVRLWHTELTAPADSEAHLALSLDGDVITDDRVQIPTDGGGLLAHEWTAPRDIPQGAEIIFHAHNHGNNEYYLLEVSRQ